MRSSTGRFLVTPTATAKAAITERLLLEVDENGKKVSGTTRPFGELTAHLAVYQKRGDVEAVVHAHPPNATAIACSGRNIIETPFIAEAVVSIGDRIPLIPFTRPGDETALVLANHAADFDAVLFANHGVFTWGKDLEQAFLRMELVEHLATIAIRAESLGGVRQLPNDVIKKLLEKRAKAGLGQAADKANESARRVIACASAPHADVSVRNESELDLASIIREEIRRVLP